MSSKKANQLVPEVVDNAGVRTLAYSGDAGPNAVFLTPAAVAPTQVRRPWRSTVRTVFQAVTGLAPMAPVIYMAATDHDPALAGGAAGVGLAIAAGVTRVMALPGVEAWLRRFVPFLAAAPAPPAGHLGR